MKDEYDFSQSERGKFYTDKIKVKIVDKDALNKVPLESIRQLAIDQGWQPTGEHYRNVSEVYIKKDDMEILIPTTKDIADYHSVISRLLEIFSNSSGKDELTLYNSLVR